MADATSENDPKPAAKLPIMQAVSGALPRFTSLVATGMEDLAARHPVDGRLFWALFGTIFTTLVLTAVFWPQLSTSFQLLFLHRGGAEASKATGAQATSVNAKKTETSSGSVAPAAKTATAGITEAQRAAINNNDFTYHDSLSGTIEAVAEPVASGGVLPKIAVDGRKPWYVYSRPFDRRDPRPRIAVVVGELGLSHKTSEAAINDLADSVTLAFASYGSAVDSWMLRARSHGHEIMLSVPMEPLDYPLSDPGSQSILVSNTEAENKTRLLSHMAKGVAYTGVTSFSGSRLTTTPDALRPILAELKSRGLFWFDARLTPLSAGQALAKEIGLPAIDADFHIDADAAPNFMDVLLHDVETSAQQSGRAIVLIEPSPMTIAKTVEWIKTLPEKGFALTPISAFASP